MMVITHNRSCAIVLPHVMMTWYSSNTIVVTRHHIIQIFLMQARWSVALKNCSSSGVAFDGPASVMEAGLVILDNCKLAMTNRHRGHNQVRFVQIRCKQHEFPPQYSSTGFISGVLLAACNIIPGFCNLWKSSSG